MATYYVRGSTTASGTIGSNAAAGTSWTVPKQTVAGALAIAGLTSGDIIVVDYQGGFTAGAVVTWTVPAAVLNIAIISVVPSGTTGFTKSAGARESVGAFSGAFSIAAAGNATNIYVYGMTIEAGSTAGATNHINLHITSAISATLTLEDCVLGVRATNTASIVCGLTSAAASRSTVINLRNCSLEFAARLGTAILVAESFVEMVGCTITVGATQPAQLFAISNIADIATVTVMGMSLAGITSAFLLLTNMSSSQFLVKNCELGATTTTGTWPGGIGSITLRNCAAADVITNFEYRDAYGTVAVATDTSLNAEFGGIGVSWLVTTTASASEFRPFVSPLLEIWNEGLSAQTATIELTMDGSPYTDRQLWAALTYPASAANPRYTVIENRNDAPFTGTGVAHPTSSAAWTGAHTNKQALELAFTASEIGLLQAQISVAAPSTTLYVNPVIDLS
jgi:hypothetical protein